MRRPNEWFSIVFPEHDEDEERRHWWNWSTEWNGAPGYGPEWRWRLVVGDVVVDMEHDGGEPFGAALTFDVRIWENTGQFAYDNDDRWHDHSVSVVVWRWGFYLAWRGGLKR